MSTDPLAADIAEAKDKRPTFVFQDESFTVERKPNPLLLAELARTDSGDPEAIGVVADFFEHVLGKEQYRVFRRVFFNLSEEDAAEGLPVAIGAVMEASFGRPTN